MKEKAIKSQTKVQEKSRKMQKIKSGDFNSPLLMKKQIFAGSPDEAAAEFAKHFCEVKSSAEGKKKGCYPFFDDFRQQTPDCT